MMAGLPILSRVFLAVAAAIVPGRLREEWRQEWEGEIWHWLREQAERGRDREAGAALASHCRGALRDAWWLRVHDERWVRGWNEATGRSVLPIAVLAVLVSGMAAASHGFQNIRRMLRPLPFPQPQRIALLSQTGPFLGHRLGVPLGKLVEWNGRAKTLEGAAAYVWYQAEVPAAKVSPNFFTVLGVRAAQGTLFEPAAPCREGAVVSHRFWREHLAASGPAIGRTVTVGGRRVPIIGVLPEGFWFLSEPAAVWTVLDPGCPPPADRRTLVGGVGRIRAGVSAAEARDELRELARSPYLSRMWWVEVEPLAATLRQPLRWYGTGLLIGLLAIALWSASGWALDLRARRGAYGHLRYWSYFAAKTALALIAVLLVDVEFTRATSLTMAGGTAFGGEPVSMWLFVVGAGVVFSWSWADQRMRCRDCLHRLVLPVRIGEPGRILLAWAGTERVCPKGCGALHTPEMELGSQDPERWLHLDDSWHSLFAISRKP